MNTAAITRKGKRRLNDFYAATPAWATQELLLRMPLAGYKVVAMDNYMTRRVNFMIPSPSSVFQPNPSIMSSN